MSFTANALPKQSESDAISNDGFWPSLSISSARESMRLDGTVTEARLRHALIAAMVEVDRDVRAWGMRQQSEGHATLADVPAGQIDGVSVLIHCYTRAVYSLVKADLIERMQDYDLAKAGQAKADALQDSPDEHRRNAAWAITRLLGRPRVTVELI